MRADMVRHDVSAVVPSHRNAFDGEPRVRDMGQLQSQRLVAAFPQKRGKCPKETANPDVAPR
jgi:hypothetical protein